MKKIKYNLIIVNLIFGTFSTYADTLLEANKIAIDDEYILVHANYTVLSKKQVFGGIELDMNDQSLLDLSSDCGVQLKQINNNNPFLNKRNSYFFIGGRSLETLWLINIPPNLYNTPCVEESLIYIKENYYETELTKWRYPRPPWQDFKADSASNTERYHFYSLKQSVNPPAKTYSLSEMVKGNGFLGLTYYFEQFGKPESPPRIPEMANLTCIHVDQEKLVSFKWPISQVSKEQEKYYGTMVSIIPLIVPPNEEAFKDMLRCDVSFDIVKSSSSIDGHEIYPVRYSVEFGEEHLGH